MIPEPKLLVIGLDCATPQLIFHKFIDYLPNIRELMESGIYGNLESTIPPITVPAWTSMVTSKDPGQLGLYGFRNRKDYSYGNLYVANANHVKYKTIWNYLSINRKTSIILGIPQTYPPRPLNGIMVGSFLTPDKSAQYTYPDHIKYELDEVADGNYIIDVPDFRTDDKNKLLANIYEMTEKRFKVVKHLLKNKHWDFFFFVEMGIDRIHHGFWRFSNPEHRLYEIGNKFENAIKDYYVYVDGEIGKLLKLIDKGTAVVIVSDHGAKNMVGGICINEWLQKEGYLTLMVNPTTQQRLKMEDIDWGKTMAWGEGGYYCRIFMNVKGREPSGIIDQNIYEDIRDELIRKLKALTDESGRNIGTMAFKPQDIYRECNNIPPDIIVYLGNLDWRSAGSVGMNTIHIFENDTGPDDANHSQEGIFIMKSERFAEKGIRLKGPTIYDVAPTILDYYGIKIPEDMIGESLLMGRTITSHGAS